MISDFRYNIRCRWCNRFMPVLQDLANILSNSQGPEEDFVLGKIDGQANSNLASSFGIRGYPTFLLFQKKQAQQDGKLVQPSPIAYNGERKVEPILNFFNSATNSKFAISENLKKQQQVQQQQQQQQQQHVIILVPENFDSFVLSPERNVVVKFHAPWCIHCKGMEQDYAKLASHYSNRADILVAEVDGSKHSDIASKFNVSGFPTVKLFTKSNKSGKIQFDLSLERNFENFRNWIDSQTNHDKATDEL